MKRKIAIIGCGGMARAHAQAIQKFGGFDFVAASDPIEAPRDLMKTVAPSIKLYQDTDEMLGKEKPELVVVGTTAATHAKLTLAAIRAGAHVLCEKPLCVSLAEADEMIAAARQVGRMFLVHHQFRINPRTHAGLKALRDGEIGQIRTIFCAGKGRFGGWELLETGTHLFDLAFLFGGNPKWVSAQMFTGERLTNEGDIIEGASLHRTQNGLVAGERVFVTAGFDSGAVLRCELYDVPSTNFLQIVGTKGLLHVPLGVAKSGVFQYPRAFVNPNQSDATWRELPVEWGKWGEEHNLYTYDLWSQWLDGARPLEIDGKNPLDAEFGRLSLEIISGAWESHFHGGRRIELPMTNREHPLQRRKVK